MTDHGQKSRLVDSFRCRWYLWDILLVAVILGIGSLLDPFGVIEYVGGTRNEDYGFFGMALLTVYGLGPLALICLIVLISRMRTVWPKHISSRRTVLALQALIGLGLLTYLMLPFLPIRPPGYQVFMSGFRRYVETNAGVESIRAWLTTLPPGVCTGMTMDLRGNDSDGKSNWPGSIVWPAAVTCFNPGYVKLSLDETGHPTVRLTWGGVFGHWGFVVGGEKMQTPLSDLSEHGEYRRPLAPGAYVWHEIQ